MKYISAFIYKEFCELKSIWKRMVILLVVTLIPLIAIHNNVTTFVSNENRVKYLILLVSFAICGQLASDLITSEKKGGTIDIILCNNIPKYAIYFGKAIPSILIGFMYSTISIIIFWIVSRFFSYLSFFQIELQFLIIVFFVGYISTAISFFANILIQDQKFVPMVALIIVGLIFGSIYLINTLFIIKFSVNIVILIFMSVGVSILSIYSLTKIKRLIL